MTPLDCHSYVAVDATRFSRGDPTLSRYHGLVPWSLDRSRCHGLVPWSLDRSRCHGLVSWVWIAADATGLSGGESTLTATHTILNTDWMPRPCAVELHVPS